jgi:SpoIID/LytB domain protein
VTVPTVLVLPVVTGPVAEIVPITPEVTSIALVGVDASGLRASAAPVVPVEPAAHAPAPATAPKAATPRAGVPAARPSAAPSAPLRPALVTAQTITTPFSLVGVDWTGPVPEGTVVQLRVREGGAWGSWSELEVAVDHGPDAGTEEADGTAPRNGTDPLLTSPGADGVQVRIDTPGGVIPKDARITLIDPRAAASDALAQPTPVSTAQAAGDPLRPAIITRAQWGADESMRNRGPIYTGPIKAAFLHHTASSSNYTPAQATAQVRALYAWYTKGLKYSDIAYNFLVDRYGRLYEGRAGGVDRNVLGGHTAGFNQNTFAVSAIGNFDTYKPTAAETSAIVTNVSKLMAWKLALNHVDPLSTATLISNSAAGTSRYAVGEKARTPAISGHRDIGSTACPGRYLETQVPRIRTLAASYMGAQLLAPALSPSVSAYGGTGTTISARTTAPLAWRLEVYSACQTGPVRVLTGTQKTAGALKVVWNQRRADGSSALPGTYRMVLSGRSGNAVAYPVTASMVVAATPTSPAGPCAEVTRLPEVERYSAAVRIGREVAPSSRTVVLTSGADSALPEALIAAPLAAVKGAPRLFTATTSLPASVATDITARKATTVYIVGSTAQVSTTVVTRLRSLGVGTVVRISGPDVAGTAAAVARAMGVRGRAVATRVDTSLDVAAMAAAAAAAAKRPLLVVAATGVPAATRDALTALGVTATTVVGRSTVVPAQVLRGLPGAARVSGADDAAVGSAIAMALAPKASRMSVFLAGSALGRALAAGGGRPALVSGSSLAQVGAYAAGNDAVRTALLVPPSTQWNDAAVASLAAAVRAVAAPTPARAPSPTPKPSTTPKPAPSTAPLPTKPPTTFAIEGSGFGHGVGMSQYGARGMALEGYTGTQIVQHYYTGTQVAPVRDDMEIRVNLLHRVSTVYVAAKPMGTTGGRVEVTVAGGKPVLGTSADIFAVKAASGRVVVTRTRAGVTTAVGTGTSVSVRWSGTRNPGTAGTGATLLNVATTVAGLSTSGHRYRYGTLDVATTSAAPTKLEVVNQLRLHDEYLLGVAEVSSSWPAATLQAQVLAARSYALARYGTGSQRAACRCHVDDGNGPYSDQTFVGYGKVSGAGGANWTAAVRSTIVTATTGKAILSGGKPIAAYYFSASGGRTQASQNVWTSAIPWATSVDDHWSMDPSVPWSRWTPRVRTQAQLAAAFALPNVARIDLSDRLPSGAVRTAKAWATTGATSVIRGSTLRSKLSLPSTWVSRISWS